SLGSMGPLRTGLALWVVPSATQHQSRSPGEGFSGYLFHNAEHCYLMFLDYLVISCCVVSHRKMRGSMRWLLKTGEGSKPLRLPADSSTTWRVRKHRSRCESSRPLVGCRLARFTATSRAS